MADPARTTHRDRGGPRELPVAARRHRLVAEVARRFGGCCDVPAGATVVIGVSGGPDSLALLLAVAAASRRRGGAAAVAFKPVAVHVNHHVRDAAGADEALVVRVCDRYGLDLQVRHVYPLRRSGNLPANARESRYEALAASARSVAAECVAVAHHAEDQLETMLMALGRGTGLDGLAGMRWSRPLADGIALVRPLLAVRKKECEDFCRAAEVAWCDDPTNADPATVRGRLRRDVLGVFETLWPDAAARACGTADVVAAARAALERELACVFGDPSARQWDRAALGSLPGAVVAAGLRRAAMNAAPEIADDLGQKVLGAAADAIADTQRRPRSFDWPGGLRAVVTAREVRLECGRHEPTEPTT